MYSEADFQVWSARLASDRDAERKSAAESALTRNGNRNHFGSDKLAHGNAGTLAFAFRLSALAES